MNSATGTRKRKHEEISSTTNGNSNESALTKGMEAPNAQPHVEEVQIPKTTNIKKENSDYQPYRNGTLIDMDEDNNHNSNEENKVLFKYRKYKKDRLEFLRNINIIRFSLNQKYKSCMK